LLALQVDEEVTQLERVVEKYRDQSGRLPTSMSDLERAGFIRGTPTDPKGYRYHLMADGRIEVQPPGNKSTSSPRSSSGRGTSATAA